LLNHLVMQLALGPIMMSKKFFWLLLPLLLAGCAQEQVSPNDPYQIQLAIYTPLCMEVQGGSMAEGAPIQSQPCQDPSEKRQQWTFPTVGGIFGFNLVNANSGQCISVSDAVAKPSTPLVQAPCFSPVIASQVWTFVPAPPPESGFRIVSALSTPTSTLCLDIPQGAVVGNTQLQVYTCTPVDPAQGFGFKQVAIGTLQ
jgi:hypothetical protein